MPRAIVGGRAIEITQAEFIIGRDAGCSLPIEEKTASRRHCKIVRVEDRWEVVDLGSRNGIVVDGRRVERARLKHGTSFRIGQTEVRFESIDAPAPPAIPGIEIDGVIGQGGMGYVYRGRQTRLGRPVAVKVLSEKFGSDPAWVERFHQEARTTAGLQHPGIVGVIDSGEAGGSHYLVLEFVDGESLQARVDEGGPLGEAEAARIGLDVARALSFAAEKKLVHRDIKPENILLPRSGPAKLCDLGIAKSLQSDAGLTAPDTVMGTAHYLAPEQAKGRPADARSDLYQLGGTLYFALTGKTPYRGETNAALIGQHLSAPLPDPRRERADLSIGFAAVLAKLMAKDPDQRYSSAAELALELERLAQGKAPLAGMGRKTAPEAKGIVMKAAQARRRRTVLLLAASGLIAVGGLAALSVPLLKLLNRPPPAPAPPPPAPPPPPPDRTKEELEKQKKRHEEALAAWKRERAELSPARMPALLASIQKRAREFARTPYEEEWTLQIDQLRADGEAACEAVWEPLRKRIADSADRGLFLEAMGHIDALPAEARTVDGREPSRAEQSRIRLKSDLQRRLEERRGADQAAVDSAARSGDFARAWDLTSGLEGAWTESEIRSMRNALLARHAEHLSRPPLTRAKLASIEETVRALQSKFVADADLIQQFEAILRRAQAARGEEIAKLEAAHRKQFENVASRMKSLGKERRFYEMRQALWPVLRPETRPETEPFFESLAADLSFLSAPGGWVLPRHESEAWAAKIREAHPKFASGSAFSGALADLWDALMMEQLCRAAAEGFPRIPADEYGQLQEGVLKHATRLDVSRVEPKDAETAIALEIVVHQGENRGNPLIFQISPAKKVATLPAADIARAAEKAGLKSAEIELRLGLLLHYAGDSKGKELLLKSRDPMVSRHVR
jgi:hypothetical protein